MVVIGEVNFLPLLIPSLRVVSTGGSDQGGDNDDDSNDDDDGTTPTSGRTPGPCCNKLSLLSELSLWSLIRAFEIFSILSRMFK